MDIYVKPKKKSVLSSKREISIGDVAEIVVSEAQKNRLQKILDLKLTDVKQKNHLISVTDIIKKISQAHPEATINNVGEMDTWVICGDNKKPQSWFVWLKVAFVSLILMTGAATAIMSFQTDSQIPKVFETYHRIFFGFEKSNPAIIAIPYSIGLAVGIIIFYNHFFGRKITDDPTPIEVEIEMYEEDVSDSMIKILERQKNE